MITYDDLHACRHAAEYKAELSERIQRLESQIEKTTTTLELARCYGQSDVQDRMAERIATLLEWRDDEWDALIDWRMKEKAIKTALDALPSPQRHVMTLRYTEGLPWRSVALGTNYSIQHCFRLHEQGLRLLGVRQVAISGE